MSLLVLHCFAQLAAEQIRYRAALICSLRAVLANGWAQENFICDFEQRRQRDGGGGCRAGIPTAHPVLGACSKGAASSSKGEVLLADGEVMACGMPGPIPSREDEEDAHGLSIPPQQPRWIQCSQTKPPCPSGEAARFIAQCKWGSINKQALANKCVPLMNISYTKEAIDILLDCFN